ncbi:MAG: hypothetical protein KDI92_01295 [Xanthomonadales bacterium]|nr:hypothetical protein [Xanthomonadales bacterium]
MKVITINFMEDSLQDISIKKIWWAVMTLLMVVVQTAHASGESMGEFSLLLFVWFGCIAWIFYLVIKSLLKRSKDTMFVKIIKILPFSLLISPTPYIDTPNGGVLPSVSVIYLSVESFNLASLISSFVAILLTTVVIYAYKYNSTRSLQSVDESDFQ